MMLKIPAHTWAKGYCWLGEATAAGRNSSAGKGLMAGFLWLCFSSVIVAQSRQSEVWSSPTGFSSRCAAILKSETIGILLMVHSIVQGLTMPPGRELSLFPLVLHLDVEEVWHCSALLTTNRLCVRSFAFACKDRLTASFSRAISCAFCFVNNLLFAFYF